MLASTLCLSRALHLPPQVISFYVAAVSDARLISLSYVKILALCKFYLLAILNTHLVLSVIGVNDLCRSLL